MTEENPEQNYKCTCDTKDTSTAIPCVRWSYLKTAQGCLKAMQMVSSLFSCCLISLVTSTFDSTPYVTWFVTVAISGFTLTGILLALHLVGMDQKYPNFLWLETEFVSSVILAVCNYFAAFIIVVLATKAEITLTFVAAAFFSFGAISAYAIDAWLKYRALRRAVKSLRRTSDPEPKTKEITV